MLHSSLLFWDTPLAIYRATDGGLIRSSRLLYYEQLYQCTFSSLYQYNISHRRSIWDILDLKKNITDRHYFRDISWSLVLDINQVFYCYWSTTGQYSKYLAEFWWIIDAFCPGDSWQEYIGDKTLELANNGMVRLAWINVWWFTRYSNCPFDITIKN